MDFSGDPAQIADLPPASLRGADGLVLKRQSANLWEEGSSVFASDPVVVLADLRASHHHDLSTQEKEASAATQNEPLCVRCDLVAEGIYETDAQGVVNPAHVHREILSGHQIGVLLPAALRTQLEAVYDKALVAQAEIAVPSVPWDLSPALRQEPALSPSMGTGDVVPGTLLHSGEMTLTATDVAIPGRGFPFVFTRTYRSQTLGNGPLGPGWDHSYHMRLRELPNGDVEYFDGRGRREIFRSNDDSTYEAPAGHFVSLERGADGWALVDARRNRVHFDRFGRLVAIADAIKDSEDTGNDLRFSYDNTSRLVRVTDTLDRVIYLEYDTSSRLTRITDFTGREFDYAYDTSGRLQEFRTPEVETAGAAAPEALTTTYAYETPVAGDLAYKLVQRDNLASVTDPKGQTWLQLTYADADGDGRSDELSQQDWGAGAVGLTYDFTTRLTTVSDRRSNVCKYNFNEAGQTTRLEDPATAVRTFDYDAEGLMIERVEPLGRRTTYTYPADGADRRGRGNLLETSVTADSRGANGSSPALVTQMQYHELTNLPTRVTDPRGAVTATERLENGLASRVTRAAGAAEASSTTYTYNDFGQMSETVNPNGRHTTYTYFTDGASRGYQREVVEDPDNLALKTQFETDARGNVTAVIDPRGVRHERDYNALDWQTEVRRAVSGSSDGAPALGYTQRSKYDKNGNLAEFEIPFGTGSQHTSVKYGYGVLDELLEVKRQIQPGDLEPLWNVEQNEYDANLNLIRTTDPEGHVVEYDYDERNLVTTIRSGLGTGALAAPIFETFTYDLERQQTSRSDGRGNVWQTAYDGYGRPKEYRDPLGNRTIVTYDDNGNVLTQERRAIDDTLLSRSSSSYDLLNRRTASKPSLWDSAPAGARDLVNQFVYDPASNLKHVIDPLGRTTEYRYDSAERLVEVIDPALNRQLLTLDAAGNVTESQSVELDPVGGSVTVSSTSTYDALNRRLTQTDGLQNTYQTFYDARGQVTQTVDPEGYSTQLTYDGLNRMTRELRPEGIEVTRSYDRDSNLTLYQDALGNQTTYNYDAAHRQTSVTYPDLQQVAYSYDAAHNLTRQVDQRGSAVDQTFDLANRLTSRTVTPALGETLVGPLAETYSWDGLNRITRAQSGTVVSELRYDSQSRLLSDRTNGREITYQYDDASNPTLTTYPSSYQVSTSFDSLDRPTSFSQVEAGVLASYGYRGPYLVQEKTLGNGLSGSTTFDAARRPLQRAFTAGDGLTVFEESLSWSPRSLKAAQSRGDWNGVGLSLGYDGAGRVTDVARVSSPLEGAPNNSVPDPLALAGLPESFHFSYDAAQNLVSRTEVRDGVPEVWDLPNDASGRNRPGSISGSPLLWDANGNLVRKGELNFEYDYRNRLTRVTDAAASEVASYAYDAFNRRVAKAVGATTTETVWDEWRAVEDYENGLLKSRRTYGIDLDEMIRMENDLNGDGVPEQSYVPLYDSTGNLVVMTGLDGKPVERYQLSPYGAPTISVDSTPPEIEQVRVTGGEIWVEVSEEVLESMLTAALNQGLLRLVSTDTSEMLPISVTQPVQEGGQARRRLVISPTQPPPIGTQIQLTFEPDSLVDLFLNRPAAVIEYVFDWPTADLVISDSEAPRVELVVIRSGVIEIEFSEEVDLALAANVILVDGQSLPWSLGVNRYILSSTPLADGVHELSIAAGSALDLNGLGLETGLTETFSVGSGTPEEKVVWSAGMSGRIASSTVGNRHWFHGQSLDAETQLLYFRNRYYDPELGRFLVTDPLGYVDGPNLYQVALNNPVNFSDPLGLATYFFDGTWNCMGEPGNNPSNVEKLFKSAVAGNERAFYEKGIGCVEQEPVELLKPFLKTDEGATGAGGIWRIFRMYHNLIKAFEAGDTRINIIGFSRGAALARIFANYIDQYGVPGVEGKIEINFLGFLTPLGPSTSAKVCISRSSFAVTIWPSRRMST